jgi:cellulose biosynthesis protein BcsQ
VPVEQAPNRVPMQDRVARIISVINLKGGVGKTTLTANLAAVLASTGRVGRILIVDLDFQHTLSDLCVDGALRQVAFANRLTSERLLKGKCADAERISKISLPMKGCPTVLVVPAHEFLQRADVIAEARFLLRRDDSLRFRYVSLFQESSSAMHYDLILFDCPPRLTASSINALACSDHVLIPTRLDEASIPAVSRVLQWLDKLAEVSHASPLGVVANDVQFHAGKLVQLYQKNYEGLVAAMADSGVGGDIVFESVVRSHRSIPPAPGAVLPSLCDGTVRGYFLPVAEELLQRLPD